MTGLVLVVTGRSPVFVTSLVLVGVSVTVWLTVTGWLLDTALVTGLVLVVTGFLSTQFPYSPATMHGVFMLYIYIYRYV